MSRGAHHVEDTKEDLPPATGSAGGGHGPVATGAANSRARSNSVVLQSKAVEDERLLIAELVLAAQIGDVGRVNAIVRAQPSLIKAKNDAGIAAIHAAVDGRTASNEEVVRALFNLEPSYHNRTLGDAEADATPLVDLATGGNHDTPLHFACAQGDAVMVDMLLKQNADRNKENKEGLLPFEVAVKHRHWEAARAVLGGDHRLGIVASRRTSSRPLVCGQTKGYWSNIFHTKGQACCYFVFVFLMCWAVILQTQRSRDVYFLSHLMEDKLLFEEFEARDSHVKKLFADIGEVTEFWQWLRGPVSSSIANPDWSSEREPRLGSGFIHGHNRVVGPVRLRQLRVRNDSCTPLHTFGADGPVPCYSDEFSDEVADTTPFGPPNATGAGSCWTYSTAAELGSDAILGRWGLANEVWYPNGGFASYLWPNPRLAQHAGLTAEPFTSPAAKVDWLRDHGWIDLSTRVVFVDMNIYNANVDMWLLMSVMAEFPATGGTVVSASFEALRLRVFQGHSGPLLQGVLLALGFVMLMYVVFGLWVYKDEVSLELQFLDARAKLERARPGLRRRGDSRGGVAVNVAESDDSARVAATPAGHPASAANTPDARPSAPRVVFGMLCCQYKPKTCFLNSVTAANVGGFGFAMALQIVADVRAGQLTIGTHPAVEPFVDLQPVLKLVQLSRHVLVLVLILSCFKLLQYLAPAPFSIGLLARTMGKMGSDLFPFLVVLVVYSIGLTFAFNLAFGTQLEEYRDFVRTAVTLFRSMFGDSGYERLVRVNRFLAPVLTFLHLLIAGILFINVLIAMLNTRYDTLRKHAVEDYGRFVFRDYYNWAATSRANAATRDSDEYGDTHNTTALSAGADQQTVEALKQEVEQMRTELRRGLDEIRAKF